MAARSFGGANNTHPLSWGWGGGGGAQTELILYLYAN